MDTSCVLQIIKALFGLGFEEVFWGNEWREIDRDIRVIIGENLLGTVCREKRLGLETPHKHG